MDYGPAKTVYKVRTDDSQVLSYTNCTLYTGILYQINICLYFIALPM